MNGEEDTSRSWLSFGAESVPLRDVAKQKADGERAERLRLLGESRWSAPKPDILLRAVLAGAFLLLALTVLTR
jgi:hypothetical protein